MTKSIIIGTAGHIDHGKTALVKAMTGVDTDRLPEEKARGITIDLGFAHMRLDNTEVSFVDVPGHERFIKNMLAGIGGIDLLLLVIAADESIMPQTREHFDICNLLGIQTGAIVITKKDLVDAETLEIVKEDVKQLVANSLLKAAPVFTVSAKTGEGLEELKSGLSEIIGMIQQRPSSGIFRLPIDRVFTLKGHGTVVTGTLLSGEIKKESAAEILPAHRNARIRSVHAHNRSVEKAAAGQRTAVNLLGVEKQDLERGDVLTEANFFENTSLLDVTLHLLSSTQPLQHNTTVRFHHLTNDLLARVTLLQLEVLMPGQSGVAQLRLQRPIFALYNDHFILRKHSPLQTIGGGVILDHMPPKRISPRDQRRIERIKTLQNATFEERYSLAVEERDQSGADERFLKSKLAMMPEIILRLESDSVVVLKEKPILAISAKVDEGLRKKMRGAVGEFHQQTPLVPGISKMELRSRFFSAVSPEIFDLVLQRGVNLQEFELQKDSVALYGRKISLTDQQSSEIEGTEKSLLQLHLQSTVEELRKQSTLSEAQLKKFLHLLVRQGKAVKITDDYFLHSTIWDDLKQKIRALKSKQIKFSVPDFKTLFGVSRKYAIPLLEQLDREGVTRRSGNERIIV